jgi:DNA polymerase-3 subunit epsilon
MSFSGYNTHANKCGCGMSVQLSLEGIRSAGVLDTPLVFVDIETNGLDHIRGRVIEVAAIRIENGRIIRTFNQLIDPEAELPQFITSLTGIRPEDLRGAMPFRQIATELYDILDGAIFVAHNVRFDYSFLKQEFKRVGKTFLPRQLCTVKLSKALYPEQKSHKLASLIERHGFSFENRHRAYDDAHVLWQFLQHVESSFPYEIIEKVVMQQLKQPALPKSVSSELIKDLPAAPGVYIFEDDNGKPLYIGKSINIKKRVLQHFGNDHDDSKEFKLSQSVKHISTLQTGGELEALLLESRLVKEMMPLYNRQLRRTQKLLLARSFTDENGYLRVSLEEASGISPEDLGNVLAVYDRRSRAKTVLQDMQKTYDLCPALLGLEKSKSACFLYQLHKCRGACGGHETAEAYNRRLLTAFEHQRIREWPYQGAVLVTERFNESMTSSGIIVDQWCVIAEVKQDTDCAPDVKSRGKTFDLDTYKILQQFLATKLNKLTIRPLGGGELTQLGI